MYRETYGEDETWKVVNMLSVNTDADDMPCLERKPAADLPIKIAKWNDIQKQKQFIPELPREFYDNVKCDRGSASDQHGTDSESEPDEAVHSSSTQLPITATIRQKCESDTAAKSCVAASKSNRVQWCTRTARSRYGSEEAEADVNHGAVDNEHWTALVLLNW